MTEAFMGLVAVIAVDKLLVRQGEVINAGASLARTSQITGASTADARRVPENRRRSRRLERGRSTKVS